MEKLSDSANQLVTYIDDTIMPDYDSFVKTGEQYRTDATYVNSTMDHFEERANSLKEVVLVMKQSVEDISTAIEESAKGIANAAEKYRYPCRKHGKGQEENGDKPADQ